MRTIPLTQGKVTIVDDDAPAWIFEVKWCAVRRVNDAGWYAIRGVPREGGGHTTQRLHRVIMDAKPGEQVDHKHGDGLDNRKESLRITTNTGNQRGFARRALDNKSGYRGVCWNEETQKFDAYVKKIHVGYFSCPIEAARARDAKARELGWPEEGMNFPNDLRPAPVVPRQSEPGEIGVCFRPEQQAYQARITHQGIEMHLGYFKMASEAACVRDAKARELGWPETRMNYPRP